MLNYKQESHLHCKLYLASQIMHKILQRQNRRVLLYIHIV
jgi:hypothetical protein